MEKALAGVLPLLAPVKTEPLAQTATNLLGPDSWKAHDCPDLTQKIHYWPGQNQDIGIDLTLVQPQMTLDSLLSYHGAAGSTCIFMAYLVGVVSKMHAKAGEHMDSPWPKVAKRSADP